MNANRLVSLVILASLLSAAALIAGCGSAQKVYIPTERDSEQLLYNRRGPMRVGVATPTFGIGSVNGQRSVRATPSFGESGKNMPLPQYHSSFSEPKVVHWKALYEKHCAPGATAENRGALTYGSCQRVVDELNFWEKQVSLARYHEDTRTPQCKYGLSERTGQQPVESRDCYEERHEKWRERK